jgi:uncharacterized protein with HEPN domain
LIVKKSERTYDMYLDDLILAMSRISEYTKVHTLESFIEDYKTIDAVVRNFEVIGEAARKIPEEIKLKYPEVPWAEMYLLRNKVIHEYFGIDYEIIWDVAINHLPENKSQIEEIKKVESKS